MKLLSFSLKNDKIYLELDTCVHILKESGEIMPKIETNISEMIEEKQNTISVNTERRKELEKELTKLENSFSKNKISEEEYKSKKTKIKNDMKQAATRITRAKKEIEKYQVNVQPEYSINHISELLSIMEKKEKDIELNNRRKESINSEISKLENSYINNIISMEEYDKKKIELENDIKDVDARLNTLQQSLDAYRKIEQLDKKEEVKEEIEEKTVEPIQTSYEQYKQRMQLEKDLEYNLKQLDIQNMSVQEDRKIDVESIKQALQTHNEDDIAQAIESISNVDNMYTKNMLAPLESMMEAYTNQTYEEYKQRKQALSSLEFNLKQIENQNDFVEDSFKVDIEPIKKAIKTRNVDDILTAMDLAEKLTTSNNINAKALFADMDKVFFKNDSILASPKKDTVDNKEEVKEENIEPQEETLTDTRKNIKDILNYGKRKEPVLAKKEEKQEEVKENKITKEEVEKIFKTINSKTLADYLFQIPRGNIDEEEIDPKTEELIEMQEEKFASHLEKLINDKRENGGDNLKDPSYMLSRLNDITPYVNTHALFSEKYYDTRPDEFIVNFFKDAGYTAADAYLSENEDKKEIGKRLLDLEKYHYFRSEYDKLPYEYENLNTTKTMALATIKYLKEIDNQIDDSIDQGVYAGVCAKIAEEYNITDEMINTKAKEIEITPIEEDSFDYNNLEEGIIKETEKVLNKEQEEVKTEEKPPVEETQAKEGRVPFNFSLSEEKPDEKTPAEEVQETEENTPVEEAQEKEERVPFNFSLNEEKPEEKTPVEEVEKIEENTPVEETQEKEEKVPFNFSLNEEKAEEKAPAEEVEETEEKPPVEETQVKEERVPFNFSLNEEKVDEKAPVEEVQETEEKPPVEETQEKEEKVPFNFSLNEEKAEEKAPAEEVEETEEKSPVEEPQEKEERVPFNFSLSEEKVDEKSPAEEVQEEIKENESMEYTIPEDSRLNNYTAVKSFKQITRALYDKISSFVYKGKIKEAIARLRENNKSIIDSDDLNIGKLGIPKPTPIPAPPRLTDKEAEVVGMEEEIPKATSVPKTSIDDTSLLEASRILDETANEALGFEQPTVENEPEVKSEGFIPQTLTPEEINNLINNPKPNTDVELRQAQESAVEEQPKMEEPISLTSEELSVLLGQPSEEEKQVEETPKPNFDFNIAPEPVVKPEDNIQTNIDSRGWDQVVKSNSNNDKLVEQGFNFNPTPTPQQDPLTQKDILNATDWDDLSTQVKNEVNDRHETKIDIDNPYRQHINYEPLPEQKPAVDSNVIDAPNNQLDPHRWERVNNPQFDQNELERQRIEDSVMQDLVESDKNDPIIK